MNDTLYLLAPDFEDHGARHFCPFSAQVMGFLTYYPQVRATIDVVELPFAKPRRPISDLLGEEHQALPILVLAREPAALPQVTVGHANGHHFVSKTIEILRYLAATRGVSGPH